MRFLADENFRRDVAEYLRAKGHDVAETERRASDASIADRAKQEQRILLTNDVDFATALRFPPREYAGILVFRISPPRYEHYVRALQRFLTPARRAKHIKGKTFIIGEDGYIQISA